MNWLSSPRILRWLSLGGIVGPIIFTATWVTADQLWTHGSWVTYHISFLASSDIRYAGLVQAGFLAIGLLTLPFARAVHCGLTGGRGSPVGPLFLVVAGAAAVAAGLFQPRTLGRFADPAPEASATIAHYVAAFILFIALVLAPLFIARRLHAHGQAPRLARYSLATSVAVLLLLLAFAGPFILLDGLFERMAVTIGVLWQVVMAAWTFRQLSQRQEATRQA